MTRIGTLGPLQSTSANLDIGNGESTPYQGVDYVNQNLSGNTDYYAFVRVFSSIDSKVSWRAGWEIGSNYQ